jgi:hypothetical protein
MCNGAASRLFGTQMGQRARGHELQRLFENTEQRKLRIWRAPSVDGAPIDRILLQGAPWGSLGAFGLWNEPLWPRRRPVEELRR